MANGYTNTEVHDRLTGTAEDPGLTANERGSGLLDVAAALGLDSNEISFPRLFGRATARGSRMVAEDRHERPEGDPRADDERGDTAEDEGELPFEVEPLDTPIQKGAIDPENALFVVLGMVLTVLIVVRFLSVLP